VEATRQLSACFGDMQGLEFNIEYAGIACRLPISTAGHAAQARERGVADARDGLERFIRQKKEIHHHRRTMTVEPRSFDHQYNSAEKHYAEAKQVLQAAEIRQEEYKLANQDIKQIELNRVGN
jgi:hypothetical protein